MIGTPEIAEMIKNPNLINASETDELIQLCQKHPYSQVFPILLLKGLANSKSVNFESELSKQSYKISDRVELYNLIHQFEADTATQPEPQIKAVETVPIEPEEQTTTTESEIAETIKESVVAEEVTEVVETEEIQEVVNNEEKTTLAPPTDALEESILHNALISNYKLEELTEEESNQLEEKSIISDDVKIELDLTSEEDRPSEESAPTSFISWLHADRNYHEEDPSDKEAIDRVVNDFKDFDPLSTLSGEIEKPKVEFFSPTKKAKESLDETSLPVSETLAKIYYLQGNYPKAIEAYQQLSLKFPEKKIFFANLIKDLEKKLKT